MWNSTTCRKIAGTAAPCQDELQEYLGRHPHVQVYAGQDGGPEAIKQRRKDRNREKERRKRERKKLEDTQAGIKREEVECFVNGSTLTGNNQTEDGHLDPTGALLPDESERPSIKEEVLQAPSVEPEKLMLEQKEKESEENDNNVTQRKEVFKIGPIPATGQPPVRCTSIPENREARKKDQKVTDPATEDQIEEQLATELPSSVNQDMEPSIQPEPACTNQCRSIQGISGVSKRKMTFSGPDQWDIIIAERIWAAEAHAAIAERERKRMKEASMEEEDEEIREFRDIIRRTS